MNTRYYNSIKFDQQQCLDDNNLFELSYVKVSMRQKNTVFRLDLNAHPRIIFGSLSLVFAHDLLSVFQGRNVIVSGEKFMSKRRIFLEIIGKRWAIFNVDHDHTNHSSRDREKRQQSDCSAAWYALRALHVQLLILARHRTHASCNSSSSAAVSTQQS
jgi:hypothetical protein